MSLAVVRDLRSPRALRSSEDAAAYQEHLLAEFVLARMAHGVVDTTIRSDIAAIEAFLDFAGVWAWEITEHHADRFLGEAQRHRRPGTRRAKATSIDTFFRFLELRYRGEIHELTGRIVASPIDEAKGRHTRVTSRYASPLRPRPWSRSSVRGGLSSPAAASG